MAIDEAFDEARGTVRISAWPAVGFPIGTRIKARLNRDQMQRCERRYGKSRLSFLLTPTMKIYNVVGSAALALQALLSALLAPPWLGPWWGIVVGFGYLLISWFVGGLYLSDVVHLGIAHRALDYKPWFIKAVTLINNTAGVYVDPVSWVNRHRLHHKFSDHAGDPNKLDTDGFWKTLYLCAFPYPCAAAVANDAILKTWPFRMVSHPLYMLISPILSIGLLWLFVRDWK